MKNEKVQMKKKQRAEFMINNCKFQAMATQIGSDGIHSLLNNSLDDSRPQPADLVDLTASLASPLSKSTTDLNPMLSEPPSLILSPFLFSFSQPFRQFNHYGSA